MLLRSIILGTAAAVLSVPAAGQDTSGQAARQIWPDARHALSLDYEKRAKALQQELREMKQADGGVLTPAHLTLMQAKVEDLLASYRRDLDRIDPMAVNADGSRAH